jgi:two-component system LytT family response regulator
MINNQKEMVSKKLKELELMTNNSFFRVHNSYLVNLTFVREFVKSDGQYLILKNGTSIPISRSKKNDLIQLLNS